VRPSDLDPMAHVNNAAYIDEFDESLPPDVPVRLPRRYRLEYVAAAGAGDRLTSATWPFASGFSHRLTSADGAEMLRATFDAATDHDAFRELVARRAWRAPGKDANV